MMRRGGAGRAEGGARGIFFPPTPTPPRRASTLTKHAGGARLVEVVYEDPYYPRDLYDPEQIIHLNEAGKLVSVVALDSAGQVVGHYALERPHLEAIAESSDAIVRPEHRHHHLMEQMRVLLREEAIRLGLTGLGGEPGANHPSSHKAEEHFGAHPCGVALG